MRSELKICLLAVGMAVVAAAAAAVTPAGKTLKAHPGRPSHYALGAMPASARNFYASTLGVDAMATQLAESGQLVRFSYRIVDVTLAKPLLDKISSPTLLDERAHAILSVPTMEKVGPLRQSGTPELGKIYWVLFSNKGNVAHAGDRVSVVAGSVRIDGLVIQK